MAKIVSLIVFIFALSWTWFQFRKVDSMTVEIHAAVQSKLQLLIEETIKQKIPDLQNFRFLKMYSEKIDENKIKATFSYEYEDPNQKTKQRISGDAYLVRALSEDPTLKKWTLQRVVTGQETIEFEDGLLISPEAEGSSGTENGTEPANSGAASSEPVNKAKAETKVETESKSSNQ